MIVLLSFQLKTTGAKAGGSMFKPTSKKSVSALLMTVALISQISFAQQQNTEDKGQTDLHIGPAPVEIPKKEIEYYTLNNKNFFIKVHRVADKVLSIVSSLNAFLTDSVSLPSDTSTSLLNFEYQESTEQTIEAYDRIHHFGGWVKNKKSGDCFNTRNKVLVRENIGTIELKEDNKCSVATGEWIDPYSGNKMTDAMNEIQIDHMVPLREAYISGGYKWTFKERCLYGNYLGYKNHLIAASGEENNEKSAKTPEDYMPSNKAYHCEYLKDWLKIKTFWGLSLVSEEVDAIKRLIDENHCDLNQFVVTDQELKEQAEFFKANEELCRIFEK